MTRKEEKEQAAEEYYNKVKYLSDLSATPITTFKAGAEWADKTMLDRVFEWLEENHTLYEGVSGYFVAKELRKAIEENKL